MISRIYIAQIVASLVLVLNFFDIQLPYTNEELTESIFTVLTAGAIAWTLVERFLKGGITWWGMKVPKKK